MFSFSWMYDEMFLKALCQQQHQVKYVRITSLTFDEKPLKTIEGKAISGTINIDGQSSLRRTCSLSFVSEEIDINQSLWSFGTKFRLEIGLLNNINASYPSVIWFKQGIYVLTSFNANLGINKYQISISGKDKMCLLNGDIAGQFESAVELAFLEEVKDNITKKTPILIKDIVKNLVHFYGKESRQNIYIYDLDISAIELLEYRYNIPLYLYRKAESNLYDNALLETNAEKYWIKNDNGDWSNVELKDLPLSHLENLTDTLNAIDNNPKPVYLTNNENSEAYIFTKITNAQSAGNKLKDLVYNGELMMNPGDAITTALDAIIRVLGNFEYFYDTEGHFVFQQKKIGFQTLWGKNEIKPLNSIENYAYIFSEGTIMTGFTSAPDIANIKNDYSIWGTRQGITGGDLPIHMRYGIDKKPTVYTNFDNITYVSSNQRYTRMDNTVYCDWREVIYQMALDHLAHNQEDDFELKIMYRGREKGLYIDGKTGYEHYYTDILGFWRQLYNPTPEEREKDLFYDSFSDRYAWAKDVYESPEKLNFWFDILDTQGELSRYNISQVGHRAKVENSNALKSIYYRETPYVIFVSDITQVDEQMTGYRYIQIQDDSIFSRSAQGQSIKDRLDEMLYQYTGSMEIINCTTLPLYFLEPNTKIHVEDTEHNIYGDYILNNFSYSLSYKDLMNIKATKLIII